MFTLLRRYPAARRGHIRPRPGDSSAQTVFAGGRSRVDAPAVRVRGHDAQSASAFLLLGSRIGETRDPVAPGVREAARLSFTDASWTSFLAFTGRRA
ncbi:hypothetical protein GCM10010424_41630 [Streptomyces lienomycini]